IAYAAFYTIVLTVVVAAFRKSTRMGVRDILEALENGARQSLSVMIACAVVGIIIGVVSLTSFGTVMTSAITAFGAGSLFWTLFLTMLASIVLGMGLPYIPRSEEHTSELQSRENLVCRLLLEKKKEKNNGTKSI